MLSSHSRRFIVPKRLQGAARSWLEEGDRPPRTARLASSVVLVRDSVEGTETWLAYRPGNSPLGVVAFPGGSVQNTDHDTFDWFGPSVGHWAEMLGVTDFALARSHVVAAIRELFEETGVLLAGSDATTLVEGTNTPDWTRVREAVASEEIGFAEFISKRGLGLRTDLLRPLVHWVSPDFAHRRFDTRYFAATLPVGQTPTLLPSKGVWGEWALPARLLKDRDSTAIGDLIGEEDTRGLPLPELLVPASEIILEKIAKAKGCIAYLNIKRSTHTYQAELEEDNGQLWLRVEAPSAAPATEALATVPHPGGIAS
ncbi:NUDIX hydrolase [Sinomonas sp. ASV322]|uniref:NUDIX hydrolase n=1 Tax=Sinomonas sp. ASV322 TaxID=3041920 RepID=UPI0035A3297B